MAKIAVCVALGAAVLLIIALLSGPNGSMENVSSLWSTTSPSIIQSRPILPMPTIKSRMGPQPTMVPVEATDLPPHPSFHLPPHSATLIDDSEPIPSVLSEEQEAEQAVPFWMSWLTPIANLGLALTGAWALFKQQRELQQWNTLGLHGTHEMDGKLEAIQMRAGMSKKQGSFGGRRKKESWLTKAVASIQGFGRGILNFFRGFVRWFKNSPIDVIMLSIFLCSWALWLKPNLTPLFLVQGFSNPLAFLGSGFACFNIYQLYSDIFYVYILGKAYCVMFSPKELAILYGGGTMMGSLLVALSPGAGWMGPTAGTASLLTAFMLKYPGTRMAIPMIPLIFFPMQVRWIGTVLSAVNFYLFAKGVPSGAAFMGGVLFALIRKARKPMIVQDVSLSV